MRRILGALIVSSLAVGGSLAWSCRQDAGPDVTVRVRLPPEAHLGTLALPRGVRSARIWPNESEMTLVVDAAATPLTLREGDLCPLVVARADGAGSIDLEAKPWIDLGGDRAQIGFDAPLAVDVVPGCAEAATGRVEWRQVEGAPLAEMRSEAGGFRLRARTAKLESVRPGPLPWGIVPLSPRTQGRTVLEATWVGSGHASVRRTIVVTAAARATGEPSVAVGQRLLLGGEGWRVRAAPDNARAEVRETDRRTFEPDVPGRWVLQDAAGRELAIRAGTHDKTPLDCGRSECHASEMTAARSSPMTHALESRLGHGTGVTCMLDCHATGERGLHDGGFLDLARRGRRDATLFADWSDLPRELRRAGGVTCTACHGPGAIPEPSARRFMLRADVCATCHDAPPSYVHVAQWRASRMANADADGRAREEASCARCHTTAGFLASIGAWTKDETPVADDHVGIACAACHEPHGPHVGDALVRLVGLPSAFRSRPVPPETAVCVACHAPADGESWPSSSAATVWLGRAILPGGDIVEGPSPHGGVAKGCVACHGGSPAGGSRVSRGLDHSFHSDAASCRSCHASPPSERPDGRGRTVRERALALWRMAAAAGGESPEAPPHARANGAGLAASMDRARFEVALVLEDPAAGWHNAPFARMLLDDAERHLGPPP